MVAVKEREVAEGAMLWSVAPPRVERRDHCVIGYESSTMNSISIRCRFGRGVMDLSSFGRLNMHSPVHCSTLAALRVFGKVSTSCHPKPSLPLQPRPSTTTTREEGQSRCYPHQWHHQRPAQQKEEEKERGSIWERKKAEMVQKGPAKKLKGKREWEKRCQTRRRERWRWNAEWAETTLPTN